MKKYTLIELLVAMGIFAFMMLLLMNFFSISTDLLGRETNRAVSHYESSVFLSFLKTDLKDIQIASGHIAYKNGGYGSDGTNANKIDSQTEQGTAALRFFTNGYDNSGVKTSILVSYVYDSATYTIKRYAAPSSTVSDFETLEDSLSSGYSTYGSTILDGVEDFQLAIYTNYPLQDASPLNGSYSDFNVTLAQNSGSTTTTYSSTPDMISVYLKLNDHSLLSSGTAVTNQLLQRRRQVTTQIPMAYK
jgi:hypothetical protein